MVEEITAMLALLGVLSLLCQWIGWKMHLPAILPLLICGLLIGPVFGFLKPDEILADNDWDKIRLARMENIPVYFGNTDSEHATTFLELKGIGRLLVLSLYRQLNPLVCFHHQDILGAEKVYGWSLNDEKVLA